MDRQAWKGGEWTDKVRQGMAGKDGSGEEATGQERQSRQARQGAVGGARSG